MLRAANASNSALGLLADDHSRILLKSENSHSNSDYINASPIVSTATLSGVADTQLPLELRERFPWKASPCPSQGDKLVTSLNHLGWVGSVGHSLGPLHQVPACPGSQNLDCPTVAT